MSEKLKGCPIPGCGGAAVAAPNKENARVVECLAQDCLPWLPVGLWQALPRASESVLEVAREMGHRAHVEEDGASSEELDGWASRLESAAPGMGTPGSVTIMDAVKAVLEYDWESVILDRDTGDPLTVLGHLQDAFDESTPQPKAEAGSVWVNWTRGIVQLEQPENHTNGYWFKVRVIGAPEAGECEDRTSVEKQSLETARIANETADRAMEKLKVALQRAETAARALDSCRLEASVWIAEEENYEPTTIRAAKEAAHGFAVEVLRHCARGGNSTASDRLADITRPPDSAQQGVHASDNRAEGSSSTEKQSLSTRVHASLVEDLQCVTVRAESAETLAKERWNQILATAAQRDTALAGEAKARTELARIYANRDHWSRKAEEWHAKADTLHEQLGEANSVKAVAELNDLPAIQAENSALAERVRELEEKAVVYGRRAHQREGSLKGELHRAFTGWNKEARDFKSFRNSLASGDQMRIEYGPTGKASLRYDSALYNAVPFDVPTPPTTADEMPVCPKCGVVTQRQKPERYWCECPDSVRRSRQDWLRYCAEGTPCRVCKRPPEVHTNGNMQCPVECAGNSTWLTPAEWLDSNPTKESGEPGATDGKTWHCLRCGVNTGPNEDDPCPNCEGSTVVAPSPRAEALKAIRTELERWHFSYPERERGGFGRCVALFLDWAEAWEADHE